MLYRRQERYADAEPLLRNVAQMGEKVFGLLHPNVEMFLENHAAVLQALGRMAEAREQAERAAAVREALARREQGL